MKLLAVLLLTGCAAQQGILWGHESKNESDYRADASRCAYEAESAVAPIASSWEQAVKRRDLYTLCMKAAGYKPIAAR